MPNETGKQRKKGAPVWALALPAALLCLGVWAARPLPATVRVYMANGHRVREQWTRTFRMLPARECGVGLDTGNFCAPWNTRIERTCKLGFCAIVDTHDIQTQPVK